MNKTYLKLTKIFTIIVTVFHGIGIFTNFISIFGTISFAFFAIFSGVANVAFIIFNILALQKIDELDRDESKIKNFLPWAIYLFFGGGIISGVFAILTYTSATNSSSSSNNTSSLEKELLALDQLLNKGLITNEEYLQRRKLILSKF